jgi:hypothetical protein
MSNPSRLIEEDRKEELWKKHCGYLTLKRKEFRGIQTRLMLEQINILGSSKIGRTLMGEKIPASVEEFRQTAPLTRMKKVFRTNHMSGRGHPGRVLLLDPNGYPIRKRCLTV